MSILGKLLIVFNLLAAGAFAYFTLENWKVRKELTTAAIRRTIQLNGEPVETGTPPEGMDKDNTPFRIEVNDIPYESVPKKVVDGVIPNGGTTLGGEPVYSMTDEVTRVQKKVFANIAAQPAQAKVDWLRAYLVAVARTGAERDGDSAVFDMRDPGRAPAARRDLPLAARTESQTAALKALVAVADLGDPQAIGDAFRAARIAQARDAVKRFVNGEVPFGAADDEGRRKLQNAVLSAMQDRAGEAEKSALVGAAGNKPEWGHVAAATVEPLADRPSTDRAAAALLAYAQVLAVTPTEKTALAHISSLIRPPALNFNLDAEVDMAATDLLNAKFEEAALPAASKSAAGGNPVGEKARKIAHLLYHIDGWRYADQASAADHKAWHERVATIVGLPEYVRAAEAEATEFAEAAQRLTASITEEQSSFEAAYQAQLQRVNVLYSQYLALDQQLAAQKAITAENVRLMNERKTERDKLLEELAKAREDAKAALDQLSKTQAALFAIQRDQRNAQEALFILHDQLRKLEFEAQKFDPEQTAGNSKSRGD